MSTGQELAPLAHDEVLYLEDVAARLRTSVRTIKRMLRAGTFPIPSLPRIDRRHRWSLSAVLHFLAEGSAMAEPKRGPVGVVGKARRRAT